MTLDELSKEIRQVCKNPVIEQSIPTWLNQAVEELAAEYELPTLRLRKPATLTTTTAEYLYDLSACSHPQGYTYMKRVFRVTSAAFPNGFGLEPNPLWLDETDPTHTQTADAIQRIACEGDQLSVFPLANDTLNVWFYRNPLPMEAGDDEPDGIPAPYHYKVLVPMVVLRSFGLYPEDIPGTVLGDNSKALIRMQTMLNTGLYGDGVQIGLIPFITKAQRVGTPRIRGAPLGGSLGGRWF